MEYGLIGEKLTHSYSSYIHNALYFKDYELIEVSKEALANFLKNKNFKAINVTIPYKTSVIPYLNEISDTVKDTKVCNFICNIDNRLYGFNTDTVGFDELLFHNKINVKAKQCLILGSGASSKSVMEILLARGASSVYIASRTKGLNYEDIKKMGYQIDIIVNTTPFNMYPNSTEESLIDFTNFPNCKIVIDLIYNPYRTKLLKDANKYNIKAYNGIYMLVAQAYYSECLLLSLKYKTKIANKLANELLLNNTNIVLIGMPSAGKTTLGKLLAKKLNKQFIDTDELFINKYKIDIASFINNNGEASFRELEANIIKEIKDTKGAIIATGGGVILNENNISYLKENGILFYLNKKIKDLKITSSRPLIKNNEQLIKTYEIRDPLYSKACDKIINGSYNKMMKEIIKEMKV